MTREDYIKAVKVKLEEISPFDEPSSFIADSDGAADTVKPIQEYIINSLEEATKNCLLSLPITLLHADIERTTPPMSISENGVGTFPISTNRRFIRLKHNALKRDITAFITSEDSLYLLQQKNVSGVRGGVNKPVAVIASNYDGTSVGVMEVYSFPSSMVTDGTPNTDTILLSIDLSKKPGATTDYTPNLTNSQIVQSSIEEYIVLECAAIVCGVLSDYEAMKLCRKEIQNKLAAITK